MGAFGPDPAPVQKRPGDKILPEAAYLILRDPLSEEGP